MNFAMIVWLATLLIVSDVASTSAAGDENINEEKNNTKQQRRRWNAEKDLEMMKIWYRHFEGGTLDDNPVLREKWELAFPADKKNSGNSVMQRANSFLRQGFWIPAEHNEGVPVFLDGNMRKKRNAVWRLRQTFSSDYGLKASQTGDQNTYKYHPIKPNSFGVNQQFTRDYPDAQSRKRGKEKLDSSTKQRSEHFTKYQKHSAQEVGQTLGATHRNNNRGKRPISPDTHKNFTDFNTPSILGSTALDYGWPVNQTGHHYGVPQHYTGIDTTTPQFNPVSDYYTHQTFHFPQFEQSSYHELNNLLNYQDPSLYQYLANNPVHRPDYSQHHHAASSSNPQQGTPHSNRESNIPSSSLDPNLKYIHNNPYFPPSHDNKTF